MTAVRRTTLSALAIFLAACAGNPGPGEPGYPFNLAGDYTGQFTVEGTAIPAVMTLATGAGGAVTGSFTVAQSSPERWTGHWRGTSSPSGRRTTTPNPGATEPLNLPPPWARGASRSRGR